MKLYPSMVALLAFVASAVLVAVALGMLLGVLSKGIALAAFAVAGVVAVCAWRSSSQSRVERPSSPLEWLVIAIFIVACLRAFLWLVYVDDKSIKVLSPNNLGDLSLHWNFIRFMAAGSSFWPENPLIAAGMMRYPIGVDLLNSLLLLCGVDLIRGLIWTGLIGSLLGGAALFIWSRAFGLAGLLFNGGAAGFLFLLSGEFRDYQAEWAWKNLFLSMIVTQRGFLFCLPAGLLLLESWRNRWQNNGRPLSFWIEALFYASMPVFHIHTFMYLSMVLGWWMVFGTPAIRRYVLTLGLAALLPASGLVLLVTDFFKGPSVFSFQPGWMQHDEPFLQFWVGNFGLFIPLCLILCLVVVRSLHRQVEKAFVLPACLVFLLCCFILFAPWEWDNTKLMIWSYLTVLPFLWKELIARYSPPVRASLCVLLFFSGFVSLFGGLKGTGYQIGDRREVDAMEVPLRSVPISARFAAAPECDHPLFLHGRKVGLAYPGYLYGHGIPYQNQEESLTELMRGGVGWKEAAMDLAVDYLFWGWRESEAFSPTEQPWADPSNVVASGEWGTLYKLSP